MLLRLQFLPYIIIPISLIGYEAYQLFQDKETPYPKNQSAYAHLSSIAFGVLLGLFLRPRLL